MLLALVGGLVVPSTTDAHVRGCHHLACDRRIGKRWAKHHPHLRTAVASFYGPADSGGPLACGGATLTSKTLGVANKTLPCGRLLTVCSRTCARVRVVDRGPFIPGREFDLTIATAHLIGFPIGAGVATIRVGGG